MKPINLLHVREVDVWLDILLLTIIVFDADPLIY